MGWLARRHERKAARLAPKWSEHVGVSGWATFDGFPDEQIDQIAEDGFGWLGMYVDIGAPNWSRNVNRIVDRATKHGLRIYVGARPSGGHYSDFMLEAFTNGVTAIGALGVDAISLCPVWNMPGQCDPWHDDGIVVCAFMRSAIQRLRRRYPALPVLVGPVQMDGPFGLPDEPGQEPAVALDTILPTLDAYGLTPAGVAYRSQSGDQLPALPGSAVYVADLTTIEGLYLPGPQRAKQVRDAFDAQAVFVRAGHTHLAHFVSRWAGLTDGEARVAVLHLLDEPYPTA